MNSLSKVKLVLIVNKYSQFFLPYDRVMIQLILEFGGKSNELLWPRPFNEKYTLNYSQLYSLGFD